MRRIELGVIVLLCTAFIFAQDFPSSPKNSPWVGNCHIKPDYKSAEISPAVRTYHFLELCAKFDPATGEAGDLSGETAAQAGAVGIKWEGRWNPATKRATETIGVKNPLKFTTTCDADPWIDSGKCKNVYQPPDIFPVTKASLTSSTIAALKTQAKSEMKFPQAGDVKMVPILKFPKGHNFNALDDIVIGVEKDPAAPSGIALLEITMSGAKIQRPISPDVMNLTADKGTRFTQADLPGCGSCSVRAAWKTDPIVWSSPETFTRNSLFPSSEKADKQLADHGCTAQKNKIGNFVCPKPDGFNLCVILKSKPNSDVKVCSK